MLQQQNEKLQRIFLQPATRQCVFSAHTHAPTVHEQHTPAAKGAKIILRRLRCFVQTLLQTRWYQGAQRFTHGRHVQRLNRRRYKVLNLLVPRACDPPSPRHRIRHGPIPLSLRAITAYRVLNPLHQRLPNSFFAATACFQRHSLQQLRCDAPLLRGDHTRSYSVEQPVRDAHVQISLRLVPRGRLLCLLRQLALKVWACVPPQPRVQIGRLTLSPEPIPLLAGRGL